MKKRIGLCGVAVALFLSATGFAQEYYTLPEIRGQAAQGWHKTYTDKYNRTVQVDIDIDVFGEDKAPVIKTDVPEFVEYRYNHGSPYDSVIDVARKGGKRTHPYRTYGEEVDLDEAYGAEYGNDLTVREAFDFLNELLLEHGQGYSTEDFLLSSPASFDVVYSKMVSTGGIHIPALYSMWFWQQMHGLPIMAGAEEGFRNANTRSYYPGLFFDMRNRDDYRLNIRPLHEVEMLAEDIPLCSVEKVLRSIEGWIEGGYVQHVMSLRFGYAVYSDPSIPDSRKSNPEDECYFLVPAWVLQCVFSGEPKTLKADEIDTLSKDNEQFGEYQPLVNRIIDAQTGEMLNYFDTSKNGGGDGSYKGFIPWEDVR